MAHTNTDYLFVLAIYDEGLSLDELLFYVEPDEDHRPQTYEDAAHELAVLEETGLVHLSHLNGGIHARLTERGLHASNDIARKMSDDIATNWRARQLVFWPQSYAVAN